MKMKKIRIVLATHNQGKVQELKKIIANPDIEIMTLGDFPEIAEIAETGSTFEANALLKAQAVANATGLISIADDSGLIVDALNGAPGVYSARYGEDWGQLPGESHDQRNIRKLLAELNEFPDAPRDCKFITVIAAVKPTGETLLATGEWLGKILDKPRGSNGFGYDPVFYDPQLKKSAAELSQEEKNSRSHRGKAAINLMKDLPTFLMDATS